MNFDKGLRGEIRQQVFDRDDGRCVFCGVSAVDAHHLLERRLWPDGGYQLDNLISVCYDCHLACERTQFSVEDGRAAADITSIVVPEHLYKDTPYDKWGNVVLSNGTRTMGELADDPSVQKALREGGVVMTERVKYPRTYHLPWSNPSKDDCIIENLKAFEGQEVVVTEKMDGECTTLYRDYYHARAVESANQVWQGRVRALHAAFAYDIPEGMRVCGENLYATHSIRYEGLPSYFMGFSVWEGLTCLSWDDTIEWFQLLGIEPVPVLYEGIWNVHLLSSTMIGSIDWTEHEGYVVRTRAGFHYRDFKKHVAKYVRRNHVTTHGQWTRSWTTNELLGP